jgi:outer membrane protein insertion porin family
VKVAGNLVVPQQDLEGLILIKPGDTFSRRLITQTSELMSYRLGEDGYAFAKIDPVPQINDETKEISLTFLVDPGNRVYVRRVNFNGTTGVNDEVLRREMRQLEGAYLSNAQVERSKQRLQRLPFLEEVDVESTPVAGTPDLVDVDFQIKEGLPGQFGGGVGYSESQSVILSGNVVHSNFLGTGQRVALEVNAGRYAKVYSFSHTDPYTTIDGVSRTVSVQYRDITQFTSAASDFSTETGTVALDYGYPISEFQGVRFGVAVQRAELITSPTSSAPEAVSWVQNNGNPFTEVVDSNGIPFTFFGTRFDTFELTAGWSFDSRNRAIFATRGARHRLNFSYTVPGSDVEFWTASYDYLQFVPIWRSFTLMLNTEIAYGEDIGDTTSIPPYRQYFAGGPDTVRGYRESRLGPKDLFGNPYGGNMKVLTQAEILLPMPEKWRNSARFSIFYDMGNVFSTGHVDFKGRDRVTPVDYEFSYDKLKHSAGIAVQWLAPLGVFRFSYAVPLNAYDGDSVIYPDETEGFQFSIGSAF